MPGRDARLSQSDIFYKVSRRTEEDIKQRPKRLDEEYNATLRAIVNLLSTATLKVFEVNKDLLLTQNQKERITKSPIKKAQSLKRQTSQICIQQRFFDSQCC